ncbi:hypothetical protein B0T16DRAFT_247333 [Cercophora newfieldiana]|uniref:Uncharacterized protein n=1 Tax=Cercophora newfieldiana TaxID=92897 RepID=A0AA39XT13_9PEZI|nr:hypothetical protein B0T16DRAFT_247333 [Cercophora newfieldiana]
MASAPKAQTPPDRDADNREVLPAPTPVDGTSHAPDQSSTSDGQHDIDSTLKCMPKEMPKEVNGRGHHNLGRQFSGGESQRDLNALHGRNR